MNSTRFAMLFLAVVLPARHATAWQAEIADPAKLGFDVEVLAEIDPLMQAAIEQGKMVGCSAMIVKDDQVCYYRHWGQRDQADDLPVQRDTIWRIYSMSKPITSVAAMQLVDRGQLDLDANVSKYVPELGGLKVLEKKADGFEPVPARREVTVRDLLRHSSGMTYGFFGDSEVDRRYRKAGILMTHPDLKSMVGQLGELPLKHQPGQQFEYSVSTDVLGYLVEVVSGQRFDDYLNEHVFQPLAMRDTSFVVPADKQPRFAEMYRANRQGELVPAPARSSWRFVSPENRFFSGGGGLCSTIDDYRQFCRMLLGGGSLKVKRLLAEDSLEEMWTNQMDELTRPPRGFQFGLGFSIAPEGDYAWGGAAGTRFWVHPEKNLAILFMVQINPYQQRFGTQMRRIVYRALER